VLRLGSSGSVIVRVVIVEERGGDGSQIAATLESAGVVRTARRVEDEREFLAALGDDPDLVLCVSTTPPVHGLRALERLRERRPSTPFILVADALAATTAREVWRHEAVDFVPRDRLDGLVPTVERALARREAEGARRAESERLRLARLATDDMLWEVDLATGASYWCERYAATFGRPQETAGSWQWWVDNLHPDDRARVTESLRAAVEGRDELWVSDYRLRRADGTWVDVHDRTYIARDGDGRPTRAVGALTDVTRRRRAEAELVLRDRAIQSLTEGIMITDPRQEDNPMIYASPGLSRITGYEASELLGRNPRFLQGAGTDPAATARLRQAVEAAQPVIVVLENYRKDGTAFWNELSLAPILEDGRVTHFVGVLKDVTAQRALEEHARESQRLDAVGRLAAGVAHDFNNLLTVIKGESDLLLSDLALPTPPTREALEEPLSAIRDAGHRAAELTAKLLAFGRKAMVEPKVLDLNRAVEASVRLLQGLLGENVAITLELASDLVHVRVDPGQLDQALLHLALNARDAMPRGGSLTLTTTTVTLPDQVASRPASESPAGRYARLTVTDTGEGVPKDALDHIFEPFFSTKGVGRGTGLGLAMVYGVVRQAGGLIRARSEVGRGSSFDVLLPAFDAGAPSALPGPLPRAAPGTETILLAEDEDGVRRVAAIVLRKQGYTVLEAGSGASALRAAAAFEGAIHLVLTDVVMPEGGGRELADQLRAARPDLRVLYMSGYIDDEIVRHGIETSRDAFLQKPFTPTALARKVREVLDGGGVGTGKR
jgi:PAS domain S-box-containing protein